MVARSREFPYPRRRLLRAVMSRLGWGALKVLSDFRVIGQEHIPSSGPFILIGNHFSPFDTVATVAAMSHPLEFLGGAQLVDASPYVTWIPRLWGYYEVYRGAVSGRAMRASVAVLAQKGTLAIFPEGGSWAQVLRPARPGAAFLAVQTGVPLLPMGLDGVVDLFPALRQKRRAQVTVRFGPLIGPFTTNGHGRERREQLDEIGETMMRAIAELIPPEKRGVYSDDAGLRAAAQLAAIYPYHDLGG